MAEYWVEATQTIVFGKIIEADSADEAEEKALHNGGDIFDSVTDIFDAKDDLEVTLVELNA